MIKRIICFCLIVELALLRYFRIQNRKFFDPKNGEIIFHGLNIVNKKFPYETHIPKQDIKRLKQIGLNAIRTDVSWPGLQPKRGFINETYLQHKIEFINMMGKQGFYTLLQFHQDLFSEKFCGDGVPLWAITQQIQEDFAKPTLDDPPQYDAEGIPTQNYCWRKPWNQYYKTYAVNRAFKALYSNQYGLTDLFKNYWRMVAKAFKDNPYIIAYQIINEPWPGNMYKNPLVMVPGLSQMFNLKQFNDEIALAIREVDPQQNIGFEPVTWLNGIPAGYSRPPGGKQYADRSVLCFHYYSPPTYGMDIFLGARRVDMKRLQVGGLLTEFMAVAGSQGDPQEQFEQILQKCDKYNIGWFAWVYHETLNYELITRVYAQRVGGIIIDQMFDKSKMLYTLQYQSIQSAGETIIYFSKKHYPNGFIFTMDPMTKFQIKEERFIVIQSRLIGNRMVNIKMEKPGESITSKSVINDNKQQMQNKQSLLKENQIMKQSNNNTKIKTKNYSKIIIIPNQQQL